MDGSKRLREEWAKEWLLKQARSVELSIKNISKKMNWRKNKFINEIIL